MSSKGRNGFAPGVVAAFLWLSPMPNAALAQEAASRTPAPPAAAAAEPPARDECSREEEAALISGEIVVCGRLQTDNDQRLSTPDDARRRYAAETMRQGDPRAPALAPPPCYLVKSPGCYRVGRVPPPAYMIDFAALPDAPPGSDADRIARGLAPRGQDGPDLDEMTSPPPEQPQVSAPAASSAKSAAPAAPQ